MNDMISVIPANMIVLRIDAIDGIGIKIIRVVCDR